MKKLFKLFLIVSLFCTIEASAQSTDYTPFQLNFDAAYAIPFGTGSKGGVAFYLEPQYNITNNIGVGLRMGSALMLKNFDADSESASFSMAAVGSYLLTGNYYFQKPDSKFRPFVGIGLGYAAAAGASVAANQSEVTQDEVAASAGLGLMGRVGFDYSHFRVCIDYNTAPKTGTISSNYLGINIGFYLWGGKK